MRLIDIFKAPPYDLKRKIHKKMKRILLVIAIIVGLISCGNDKAQQAANSHNHQHSESCTHDHDHNHDHNHEGHDHAHSHQPSANSHSHDHGDDAITFPVDQQKKIDFEVVEVVTEPLYQVIRTSAQIVPSQEG